jgi:hypothetical protein
MKKGKKRLEMQQKALECAKDEPASLGRLLPCGTDAACKNLRVERTGRCYLRNCPAVRVMLL